MIPRIFVKDKLFIECETFLSQDTYHYVVHVLRKKQGDSLNLIDCNEKEYLAKIEQVDTKREIIHCRVTRLEKDHDIIQLTKIGLIQAIPKINKMDTIVRESTELGINCIYPLISERTQIFLCENSNLMKGKLRRWRYIAQMASQQSQRLSIPEIHEPCEISHISNLEKLWDIKLVCWEKEKHLHFRDIINQIKAAKNSKNNNSIKSIIFAVGPEGGFTEKEIHIFKRHLFLPIKLGKLILKTQTVAIVMLSLIQYELGNI